MKTARVGVDGRSVAVVRITPSGNTSGAAPIVFLHEGLGAITMWKNVPEALAGATGREAVGYDRLGHGSSDPLAGPLGPEHFQHEAFHVLPRLLEELGIEEPVILGHSDGATIALLHASRYPVRAVVSLAAHVIMEEAIRTGIRAVETAWVKGDLHRRLIRHHGAGAEAIFRAWAAMWLNPNFRDWSIVDALSSVTAPVLVIQGAEDAFGSLAQVDAIMAGLQPGLGERLVIAGCGHTPHLEAWETTRQSIVDFLDRVDPMKL